MPNVIRDIRTVDSTKYPYIIEQNVSVPLKHGNVLRCNVYRPPPLEEGEKHAVIVTCGPYGKDVPYKQSVSASASSANINTH
jgi:hypothetical protein